MNIRNKLHWVESSGDIIAGTGYFLYLIIKKNKLLDFIARKRYFGYLIIILNLPR